MAEKKEEKTQHSVSDKKLQTVKNQETSENLSKSVATRLLDLMNDVNKDDVTPESVNAACNCAAQIHKILRLNFDIKRADYY